MMLTCRHVRWPGGNRSGKQTVEDWPTKGFVMSGPPVQVTVHLTAWGPQFGGRKDTVARVRETMVYNAVDAF